MAQSNGVAGPPSAGRVTQPGTTRRTDDLESHEACDAEALFFFDRGSVDNELACDILNKKCFFKARRFYLQGAGRARHFKHLASLLKTLSKASRFTYIYAYATETREDPSLFLIKDPLFDTVQFNAQESQLPGREFFDDLIALPNCNGGYISSMDDFRPLQKSGTGPRGEPAAPENSKPSWQVPGLMYRSAWRMWFARRAFEYFPRERLLAFGDCVTAEETPLGGVFLQLYSDLQSYAEPETIERRLKLAEWLDFSGVCDRADAPIYETGRLPSGRVYLITWLDPNGKAVIKPEATQASIACQAGGHPVERWIEPKDIAAAIADDPSVLDGPLEPDLSSADAKARFDLRLVSYPDNKVQVIRALATATECSLAEAKHLIDRGPCDLLVNRPTAVIRRARSALEAVGAEVFVQVAEASLRVDSSVSKRRSL